MQFYLLLAVICLSFACNGKNSPNNSGSQTNSNALLNSNQNSNVPKNSPTPEKSEVNADFMKQLDEQQKESRRLAEEKMKSGGAVSTPTNSNQPATPPKSNPPKSSIPPSERRTS